MARHDDDIIWKFLTGLGGFLLVMLVLTVFRGYVLAQMWGWFVVPLGVSTLTIAHAVGISMLVSFLTYQHDATRKPDDNQGVGEKLVEALFTGCFLTAWMWGLGAVVHSFM